MWCQILMVTILANFGKALVCGPNSIFSKCTTGCEITCQNKYSYPMGQCPLFCIDRCVCSPGFIKDTSTGLCVLVKNCPRPTCGNAEEYLETGIECDCEYCTFKAKSGCYCKNGFIRNGRGECVSRVECFFNTLCQFSDENTEFARCVGCQETCPNLLSGTNCRQYCKSGCQCKMGYLLDDLGRCVQPSECPIEEVSSGLGETTVSTSEPPLTTEDLSEVTEDLSVTTQDQSAITEDLPGVIDLSGTTEDLSAPTGDLLVMGVPPTTEGPPAIVTEGLIVTETLGVTEGLGSTEGFDTTTGFQRKEELEVTSGSPQGATTGAGIWGAVGGTGSGGSGSAVGTFWSTEKLRPKSGEFIHKIYKELMKKYLWKKGFNKQK